jgi:hypothetical protein
MLYTDVIALCDCYRAVIVAEADSLICALERYTAVSLFHLLTATCVRRAL